MSLLGKLAMSWHPTTRVAIPTSLFFGGTLSKTSHCTALLDEFYEKTKMADNAGVTEYNDSNRAFLQAFMAYSSMTFEEARPVLAAIFSAHGMFSRIHNGSLACTDG